MPLYAANFNWYGLKALSPQPPAMPALSIELSPYICAFPLNCHALSFTAMCERSFLLWDTTGSFQLALSFSLRTCATLRSSGSYPASGGTSRPCPAFAPMAPVPLLAVTSPFRGAYVPYARSSRASRGFAALPTGRSVRRITGRREKEQIATVHSHCRMYSGRNSSKKRNF